jgi:hypothetical protein
MGKTGSVKHTHKYFKRDDGMWACGLVEEKCTHYMPRNMKPLPVGMLSVCWSCSKEFQLTPVNMENTHPQCDSCSEETDMLDKYLKDKLKPVTGLAAFGARTVRKEDEDE